MIYAYKYMTVLNNVHFSKTVVMLKFKLNIEIMNFARGKEKEEEMKEKVR